MFKNDRHTSRQAIAGITRMSQKKMRVWWIPQVPGNAFHKEVRTIEEALLLLDALADYDSFQYENRIKPDYSNAGGLQVSDGGEWVEYEDGEGRDIGEIKRENEARK